MTLVDARECWQGQVMVERFPPLAEGLEQRWQLDVTKASSRMGKIPDRSVEHRSHAHPVPLGVMMKGDRDLNHPLKKLLVLGRGGPPDVFKNLVSIKKLGVVE